MYTKATKSFFFFVLLFFISGCANENLDESPLPWATPAGWEGRLPGFGAGSNN